MESNDYEKDTISQSAFILWIQSWFNIKKINITHCINSMMEKKKMIFS